MSTEGYEVVGLVGEKVTILGPDGKPWYLLDTTAYSDNLKGGVVMVRRNAKGEATAITVDFQEPEGKPSY